MSDEDWNLVLDVDLKGVFFCVQAAAPQMIRQAYGKIVNISSALGTGTTPHNTAGSPAGSSAYASAKAGVIQLTKTLARELGPHKNRMLQRPAVRRVIEREESRLLQG
jgi:3-oxoacyl-[acyl-carrier protein] reductase